MTGLNSWLSPAVLHALGWALIHSLWQSAGVAALAALVMAFSRRPSVRYVIGVGALALMLAAPVATFLVLAKPAAPVQVLQPGAASVFPATPPLSTPVAVFATADRAIGAIEEAPRQFPVTDILPWLVAAWACGVAFFSLRFAGGFLLLEHRRRTQSHLPSEHVLALCLDLQRRLGLDRAIQYLECDWVQTPAVIGWLRPAVLLPVFALTGLSEEQFRAVIAHELAHIRRHDWLVNLFQVLVESLLFYHPAMWWLNRRIRIERELCCDEIAVSLTGSRLEYARALAQMAEWKNVSMLALAANRGPLTQRILHILGRKPGAGQRVAGLTGGVLFLAAALAAANLLFGIAYPVQMAEAKESVRVALVSSQNAVADLARKVVLTAKDAAPPSVAPDQINAAADSKADALAVPSSDLSRVLPNQSLATPMVVASNILPVAAPSDQPIAPALSTAGMPREPRTKTEAALGCLLGFGQWQCQNRFFGPRGGWLPYSPSLSYCAQQYVRDRRDNCPNGPLEEVDYLGTNATGDDVYAVQFMHAESTYVLQQPGRDGTIANFWIRKGSRVMQPSRMQVTTQAGAGVIYKRTATEGGAQADSIDRQAANAPPATTADDQAIPLASVPGQTSAPRTRTEPYMGCYLGFGSWTCPSYLVTPLWWCGEEYAQRQARDCPEGPLEQVDYLGTNTAGADVYAVKFRNVDMTYVVAPPGPDGKKGALWIKRGNPSGNVSSSLTAVTSQTGAGLIYKRTATNGGPQADPSDRHAALDPPSSSAATSPKDQTVAPVRLATANNRPFMPVSDAAARPGTGTRNPTELAMKCWLGVVAYYNKCWKSVCDPSGVGPIESVEYLGRTDVGTDIYQVRYTHGTAAYGIVPDPKGTATQYLVKAIDPYWLKREISPRVAPTLIYTRPEDAPPAYCPGPPGTATGLP